MCQYILIPKCIHLHREHALYLVKHIILVQQKGKENISPDEQTSHQCLQPHVTHKHCEMLLRCATVGKLGCVGAVNACIESSSESVQHQPWGNWRSSELIQRAEGETPFQIITVQALCSFNILSSPWALTEADEKTSNSLLLQLRPRMACVGNASMAPWLTGNSNDKFWAWPSTWKGKRVV